MIIVDACVAAKLFIAEEGSEEAERLFQPGVPLIAPDLILLEVASALQKNWRRGVIDEAHMDRALNRLPTLFNQLFPTPSLVANAAIIARILRHPVPDCVYMALCWKTGARVVTADEAFIKATRNVGAWSDTAIRLKDFQAAP